MRNRDCATTGAIDFDAALEAYMKTGDAEELLRASDLVLGTLVPLDEDRADTIAALTGCAHVLVDYDDAARAVRRWFALMAEPGARH
jgi:hypothetical protein